MDQGDKRILFRFTKPLQRFPAVTKSASYLIFVLESNQITSIAPQLHRADYFKAKSLSTNTALMSQMVPLLALPSNKHAKSRTLPTEGKTDPAHVHNQNAYRMQRGRWGTALLFRFRGWVRLSYCHPFYPGPHEHLYESGYTLNPVLLADTFILQTSALPAARTQTYLIKNPTLSFETPSFARAGIAQSV